MATAPCLVLARVATSFPLLMPPLSWLPHLQVLEDLGMVLEPFFSILHVDVLLPTYLPTVVLSPLLMASNLPSSLVRPVLGLTSSSLILFLWQEVTSLAQPSSLLGYPAASLVFSSFQEVLHHYLQPCRDT